MCPSRSFDKKRSTVSSSNRFIVHSLLASKCDGLWRRDFLRRRRRRKQRRRVGLRDWKYSRRRKRDGVLRNQNRFFPIGEEESTANATRENLGFGRRPKRRKRTPITTKPLSRRRRKTTRMMIYFRSCAKTPRDIPTDRQSRLAWPRMDPWMTSRLQNCSISVTRCRGRTR